MKWIKKGLIYGPSGEYSWAKHSALQPTPILISNDVIRVYSGFRDDNGVSRIGFVDVNAENPSIVINVSKKSVLDIGIPGTFDENGVVPSAIIKYKNKLFLHYAGYQLGQKVRFYVFGGLAVSKDNGNSFIRYSNTPILERTDEALLFRVIHSIIFEDGRFKIWYGGGSKFIQGKNKTLPVYNIRFVSLKNQTNFPKKGTLCLNMEGNDEHRVARPYVIKENGFYRMFYAIGTKSKGYRLGYAESENGIKWIRKDNDIGIDVSKKGWDSQMISYPSIVKYKDKVYMFYNGNDYGKDGFGYAILEEW